MRIYWCKVISVMLPVGLVLGLLLPTNQVVDRSLRLTRENAGQLISVNGGAISGVITIKSKNEMVHFFRGTPEEVHIQHSPRFTLTGPFNAEGASRRYPIDRPSTASYIFNQHWDVIAHVYNLPDKEGKNLRLAIEFMCGGGGMSPPHVPRFTVEYTEDARFRLSWVYAVFWALLTLAVGKAWPYWVRMRANRRRVQF